MAKKDGIEDRVLKHDKWIEQQEKYDKWKMARCFAVGMFIAQSVRDSVVWAFHNSKAIQAAIIEFFRVKDGL